MAYPQYKKNTFKEYYFDNEFVKVLASNISAKNLKTLYDINTNTKYTLDYMVEALAAVCNNHYGRLRLPQNLSEFMHQSEYQKYSKHKLKTLIKQYMLKTNNSNNSFFNTYVVIGYDVPVPITELHIVI
jgi:hypothetical protein